MPKKWLLVFFWCFTGRDGLTLGCPKCGFGQPKVRLRAAVTAVYDSLLSGIRSGAPWLLFYVLLAQFYESLRYVLP